MLTNITNKKTPLVPPQPSAISDPPATVVSPPAAISPPVTFDPPADSATSEDTQIPPEGLLAKATYPWKARQVCFDYIFN